MFRLFAVKQLLGCCVSLFDGLFVLFYFVDDLVSECGLTDIVGPSGNAAPTPSAAFLPPKPNPATDSRSEHADARAPPVDRMTTSHHSHGSASTVSAVTMPSALSLRMSTTVKSFANYITSQNSLSYTPEPKNTSPP